MRQLGAKAGKKKIFKLNEHTLVVRCHIYCEIQIYITLLVRATHHHMFVAAAAAQYKNYTVLT